MLDRRCICFQAALRGRTRFPGIYPRGRDDSISRNFSCVFDLPKKIYYLHFFSGIVRDSHVTEDAIDASVCSCVCVCVHFDIFFSKLTVPL